MSDSIREKIEEILGVSHTDESPTEEVAALIALLEQEKRQYVRQVLSEKAPKTMNSDMVYGFFQCHAQTIRNMETDNV
jgi:hypothetical protein